jgi:hypothetical protein
MCLILCHDHGMFYLISGVKSINNELMTFEEFLGYTLNKKNISATKLASLTNTKSHITIQRLLKDESSLL